MVIVPGSVFLVFNLSISGHENNTVVNNISRNLVKKTKGCFRWRNSARYNKLWSISNISRSLSPQKKSAKICWDTEYHLKTCENSELMPETRTTPTKRKLPWQLCITPNIAFRLTTRFCQIMGFFYPKSLPHPLKFWNIPCACVWCCCLFWHNKITNIHNHKPWVGIQMHFQQISRGKSASSL